MTVQRLLTYSNRTIITESCIIPWCHRNWHTETYLTPLLCFFRFSPLCDHTSPCYRIRDLEGNQLTGSIPDILGDKKSLYYMYVRVSDSYIGNSNRVADKCVARCDIKPVMTWARHVHGTYDHHVRTSAIPGCRHDGHTNTPLLPVLSWCHCATSQPLLLPVFCQRAVLEQINWDHPCQSRETGKPANLVSAVVVHTN